MDNDIVQGDEGHHTDDEGDEHLQSDTKQCLIFWKKFSINYVL